MRPGGPLGDRQIRGDLLVAPAAGDQSEDLQLALGQRLGRALLLALAQPAGQQAADGRIEVDLAGVGGANGGRDLVGFRVLEDIAGRAGLERRGNLLLLHEARDRHDLDLRAAGP